MAQYATRSSGCGLPVHPCAALLAAVVDPECVGRTSSRGRFLDRTPRIIMGLAESADSRHRLRPRVRGHPGSAKPNVPGFYLLSLLTQSGSGMRDPWSVRP